MHRPPLPPGNIPGTHFCQRLSQPQGHSAAGRIMSMKNSSGTIRNRTRDLPACSAVLQPTEPLRAPKDHEYIHENLRIAGVPASVRSGYLLNKRIFGHFQTFSQNYRKLLLSSAMFVSPSVGLSVRPHGTTLLSLNGLFSTKFITSLFKNLSKKFKFLQNRTK